jgi:hypothetical protein
MRIVRHILVAGLFCFSTTLLIGQSSTATAAAGPSDASSYTTNPKWKEAMHEGETLLRQEKPQFAKDSFNKANKIAGGECWDCLEGLYTAQLASGD